MWVVPKVCMQKAWFVYGVCCNSMNLLCTEFLAGDTIIQFLKQIKHQMIRESRHNLNCICTLGTVGNLCSETRMNVYLLSVQILGMIRVINTR